MMTRLDHDSDALDCSNGLCLHLSRQQSPDVAFSFSSSSLSEIITTSSSLNCEAQQQRFLETFEPRGPKPLLEILAVLSAHNALTTNLFGSLLLYFLPTLRQRLQKKGARINKAMMQLLLWAPEMLTNITENLCCSSLMPDFEAANILFQLKPALMKLCNIVAKESSLHRFSPALTLLAHGIPVPYPSSMILDFLREFQRLPLTQQSRIILVIAEELLPVWERVLHPICSSGSVPYKQANSSVLYRLSLLDISHLGTTCNRCRTPHLAGPRFRCETCCNYNLCGSCWIQRWTDNSHPSYHVFRCLFRDVRGVKRAYGGRRQELSIFDHRSSGNTSEEIKTPFDGSALKEHWHGPPSLFCPHNNRLTLARDSSPLSESIFSSIFDDNDEAIAVSTTKGRDAACSGDQRGPDFRREGREMSKQLVDQQLAVIEIRKPALKTHERNSNTDNLFGPSGAPFPSFFRDLVVQRCEAFSNGNEVPSQKGMLLLLSPPPSFAFSVS